MHHGTPEAYLKTLVRQLNSLNVATSYLEDDEREEFAPELHQALRACQMTSLLYGNTVVAVAGSQGAGKTTLVRELYEIDTCWLAGNEGQGERVPVMVLEDVAVTAPQGFLYKWTDDLGADGMRGTPVSPKAFKDATRAWGGDTLTLPVLRVPVRYGGGRPNTGFMLLPGYEEINRHNQSWQEFMRLALVASGACVLVTDGSLLAQQQDIMLVDLKEQQLAGVNPVIAITKTEEMEEERRVELRATASTRFGVPAASAICTGSGNIGAWKESLLAALGRHGGIGVEARSRQLQDLEKLSRMVGVVVSEARRAIRTKEDLSDGGGMLLDVLEELKQATIETRDAYKKRLDKALDEVAALAGKAAEADYNAAETGWRNAGRHVWDWASLTSHKGEQRAADRLQAAVLDQGGGAAFAPTHAALLADLAKDRLVLPITPAVAPGDGAVIEHAGAPGANSLAMLGTLVAVRRRPDSDTLSRQQGQSLRQEIRRLPAIAATYLSAMQTAVVASAAPEKVSSLPDLLQQGTATIGSMNGLTKDLIKAAAAVLVIDVADGEIDSIPGLVNGIAAAVSGIGAAFSGGITMTGAGAAGAAGTGAAAAGGASGTGAAVAAGTTATAVAAGAGLAIGAAVVAYGGIEALGRHQAKGAEQAKAAVHAAVRDQKTRHLAAFDEMMDWLRGQVNERLHVMLRLDEALGQRLRAQLAISDLADARACFQEEARAQFV